MIKLKLLYEQIIKESGDLNNIKPYDYKKTSSNMYYFLTEDNKNVYVKFSIFSKEDIDELNKTIHNKNILQFPNSYNVVFDIEGVESQFQKSNFPYYVKILKTVLEIILNHLNNNKDITSLTFYGAHRDNSIITKTDPTKSRFYKIIMIQNIKRLPNWDYSDSSLDDSFEGFTIYKKNNT